MTAATERTRPNVGVLGPITAEMEDVVVPLGGAKQRHVLAMLIASAPRPVRTGALVADIYGESPPERASRTVQTYVSALRRQLGDVIQGDRGGYRFVSERRKVDAHRFQDLVIQADDELQPGAKLELLDEALALWRGDAYQGIDGHGALTTEIVRLREEKLAAIEARVEAQLALGRHRSVLYELESLVIEHPLRERLRYLQMLALYRSARQAEALSAYSQARVFYLEEMGLDPSPSLQRLEVQILNHDPSLEWIPQPERTRLPHRYSSFGGREDELADLAEHMKASRLVTVTGPGGIGKSSLAVEACRTLTEVTYANVESANNKDVLTVLARSLGAGVGPEGVSVPSLVMAAGSRPSTLLIDGCENVVETLAPVVDQLLRGAQKLRIVATSREPFFLHGERVMSLGPLETGVDSAATRLFSDRFGSHGSRPDPTLSARICDGVDGVPLAIELAASRARRLGVEAVASRLDDLVLLLENGPRSSDRHRSLTATLDSSYDLLEDAHRSAFRRLSLFKGSFTRDAAAELIDRPRPDGAIDNLIDDSLISPDGASGLLRMLEPVRQYAFSRLNAEGEVAATRSRHASWMVEFTAEADSWVADWDRVGELRGLSKVRKEIDDIMEWSVDSADGEHALRLVASLGRALCHFGDFRAFHDLAVRSLDTSETRDRGLKARAASMCGWMMAIRRRFSEANDLQARAEEFAQGSQDPLTRYVVDGRRAAITSEAVNGRGPLSPGANAADSTMLLEQSLQLFEQVEHHATRAGLSRDSTQWNRALTLFNLRRFDESEKLLRELVERIGRETVRTTSLSAGFAMRRGDLTEVKRFAEMGLELGAGHPQLFHPLLEALLAASIFSEDWKPAVRTDSLLRRVEESVGRRLPDGPQQARIAVGTNQAAEVPKILRAYFEEFGPISFTFEMEEETLSAWYSATVWLAHEGHKETAGGFAVSAPELMKRVSTIDWEAVGEKQRWGTLGTSLPPGDPRAQSIEEARKILHDLFVNRSSFDFSDPR